MKNRVLRSIRALAAYVLSVATILTAMPMNALAENEVLVEDTEESSGEVREETVSDSRILGPSQDYFLSVYDIKNQSSGFYDEDGHRFNDTYSLDGASGHKVQKLVFGQKPSEINGEAVWKIAGTEAVDGVDTLVLFRDMDNYKYPIFYSESSPKPYKSSRIYDVLNSNSSSTFDANIFATTSDKLRENVIKHEIGYKVYNTSASAFEDEVAYNNYEYIPDGEAGNSYITVGYDNGLKVDKSNWGVQSEESIWLRSDAASSTDARTADGSGQVKAAAKTGLGYITPVMNIKTDKILFASRAGVLENECKNKVMDSYMESHDGAMYLRFDGQDKIRSTVEFDRDNNKIIVNKSSDDFGDVYLGMQCSLDVIGTPVNMFTAEKLTKDMTFNLAEEFAGVDLSKASDIQIWLEYWDVQDKMAYAVMPERQVNTCRIGAKEYPSLKAAIDSVTGSEKTTITMITDETISEKPITKGNNRNIVIDLKGKTITSEYKGSAYALEVFDTDKIELKGNGVLKKTGIKISGGELILDGPTIEDVTSNAVYATGGKTVIKSGVYAALFSAVEDKGITIEGGYFSGNLKTSVSKYAGFYDIKGGYFINIDAAKLDLVKKAYIASGYELITTLEKDTTQAQEARKLGYRYMVDVEPEPEKVETDKILVGASVKSTYKGVNYYIFSDGTMYLKGNAGDDLVPDGVVDYDNYYPWQDPSKCDSIDITKVFCDFNPDSWIIDGLFAYMDSLETVEFGDSFKNNTQAGSFKAMFEGCSSLTSVDLSGVRTDNLYDISEMFAFCSSLEKLDVSSFEIKNVNNMTGVFQACYSLDNLDLSYWNKEYTISAPLKMNDMFKDCSSLTVLSVANWDVSKADDISGMFAGCEKLQGLDISEWDVSNVTNMSEMFADDENLRMVDLSKWNLAKADDMSRMFFRCKNLYNVSVDKWNVAACTDLSEMFEYCNSIEELSLADWEITGDATNLLNGCGSLREIICPKSVVADIALPFEMCEADNSEKKYTTISSANVTKRLINPKTIDADHAGVYSGVTWIIKDGKLSLTGKALDRLIAPEAITELHTNPFLTVNYPWLWFSSEITSVECDFDADGYSIAALFKGLDSLESITFGEHFNTDNVKSFAFMFFDCNKLNKLDLSAFNVASADDFAGMFAECSSLESIKTSGWNLAADDISMEGMFDGCEAIYDLDLENWDVARVIDMKYMFCNTTSLTELDLSKWNPVKLQNMEDIFQNSGLVQIKLGNWSMPELVNASAMFERCKNLLELDLSGCEFYGNLDMMLNDCNSLLELKTPKSTVNAIKLPYTMYDLEDGGKAYTQVEGAKSITLSKNMCKHEKTHESVAIKPGCEKKGLNFIICDDCKEKVGNKDVEPLGHLPLDAVEENRVEPTTEKKGSVDKVVYCGRCGEELSRVKEDLDIIDPEKPGDKDPEKDPEAGDFAAVNENQIKLVKDIVDNKKGSSQSPVSVDMKQSKEDTAVIKTGFIKGKAKTFTITGLDLMREDVVNINAGSKISIDGIYTIASVTVGDTVYTDAKEVKKYAKASVKTKKGVTATALTTKAGNKYPDSYVIMLNGDKGALKLIVSNVAISKEESKLTLSSAEGSKPGRIGLKTLASKKLSNIGAVVWNCNKVVIPAGEKNAIVITSKAGDVASVYVDAVTGEVVVTPIKSAAGKLKLIATCNGKTYKAAVTIAK